MTREVLSTNFSWLNENTWTCQKLKYCTILDNYEGFGTSGKQANESSSNMILNHVRKGPLPHVVFFDVLGIVLVLVGALYTHYHENSVAGEIVFWVGFVVLIVALILFVWVMGNRKS